VRNDFQTDPQHPPRQVEEDALPRVEADEAAFVIRLDHEKDDGRDDGEIGQHASHVVG